MGVGWRGGGGGVLLGFSPELQHLSACLPWGIHGVSDDYGHLSAFSGTGRYIPKMWDTPGKSMTAGRCQNIYYVVLHINATLQSDRWSSARCCAKIVVLEANVFSFVWS